MLRHISTYPAFCPIDLELKHEIDRLTKKYDKYSDFSFVNLYTWDTNSKAAVSILNANLVIKIPDYQHLGKYTYTLIGDNKLDETINTLINDLNYLELVPEFIVKQLNSPERYAIAEDRGSFDYVYRVVDLAEMRGKKLSKKRNHVNVTMKELGSRIRLKTTTSLTNQEIAAILSVVECWNKDELKADNSSRFEYIALKRLFDKWARFDLQITLCYLDDVLVGFTVYEVNEDMSICHFEKCLHGSNEGLGTLLVKEAAKQLVGKSLLANWEQDLGIPGLNKSKLSYKPLKYMRKYKISFGRTK